MTSRFKYIGDARELRDATDDPEMLEIVRCTQARRERNRRELAESLEVSVSDLNPDDDRVVAAVSSNTCANCGATSTDTYCLFCQNAEAASMQD